MNKRLVILISIVVLACVGIIGASYLLRQSTKGFGQPLTKQNQDSTNPATDFDASTSANLPALPASPSAAQVDKYVEDVKGLSKEGDTLEITGCLATPNIFKVKKDALFNIKNNDAKEITIAISPKATYKVGAGKVSNVKMTASAAIYKYNCMYSGETSYKQAGIIEVIK